jgi:hypothetical protein
VCSSITTRTPRTVLCTADARCTRLGVAGLGRGRRLRPGGCHPGFNAPRVSRSSATCTRRSATMLARSKLCSSSLRQGMGDAPWPPHYRRQASEPPRVQPSKGRSSKRRSSKRSAPLLEIGRARRKEDALAGMERWKARHPQTAAHLQPADLLIDSMRGRYSTWTRIRINLQHLPEDLRPAQEPLDPHEKILSSS